MAVIEAMRVTYSQDWPAYNAAQTHEKEPRGAVAPRPLRGNRQRRPKPRRPRLPLSDGIFAAIMKVYGTTNGRPPQTDLREYEAKGLVDKAPCHNTVFKVLESPEVTPILRRMLEENAAPLKAVETDFLRSIRAASPRQRTHVGSTRSTAA